MRTTEDRMVAEALRDVAARNEKVLAVLRCGLAGIQGRRCSMYLGTSRMSSRTPSPATRISAPSA